MKTDTILDYSEACKASVAALKPALCYTRILPERLTLHEIDEEGFFWGLECVPPRMMRGASYLCGEPYCAEHGTNQPIYQFGGQVGDRYFLSHLTVARFEKLTDADVRKAVEWLDTDFTPHD